MTRSVRVVEQPEQEPVTLVEAKLHCRVESDITVDDDLIEGLISAARQWAENYCNRYFALQTVELTQDGFPVRGYALELPGGEVQEVQSITYRDTDDILQEWDADEYISDLSSVPARVEPAQNYTWPAARARVGAVKVRYQVGAAEAEGSPSDFRANIPRAIRHAMLMLVGHWYEQRESVVIGQTPAEVPHGVESLLWPYRILGC